MVPGEIAIAGSRLHLRPSIIRKSAGLSALPTSPPSMTCLGPLGGSNFGGHARQTKSNRNGRVPLRGMVGHEFVTQFIGYLRAPTPGLYLNLRSDRVRRLSCKS